MRLISLQKILRYTKDHSEKSLLSSAIKAFVVSLSKTLTIVQHHNPSLTPSLPPHPLTPPTEELEANIAHHKRSAELLELQETLCWPSVVSLDPDSYIPEVHSAGPSQLSSHDNDHHSISLPPGAGATALLTALWESASF